ncbi:MAG: class E sortase [Actinobacteria bacterium]|nr:class E sortase [Actinomycetota bacterium]
MRLIAPVLVFAGLLIFGYSVLIGDPLASATLFTTGAPDNSTLKLTVPEMQRVNNVPVYDGPANDEAALHDGALHLNGTGFPWQQGANVYIAGHRLGFPGTKSYLVFWDLNKLENGDEVILTDANGTRYTYEVFKGADERELGHRRKGPSPSPFYFFFLSRGRNPAASRSTGSPPSRCRSTTSGTSSSRRPRYQVPPG